MTTKIAELRNYFLNKKLLLGFLKLFLEENEVIANGGNELAKTGNGFWDGTLSGASRNSLKITNKIINFYSLVKSSVLYYN